MRSVVAVVALLALTACGGGDDSDKTNEADKATATPTIASTPAKADDAAPTPELRDAVQAYSDAFLTGDSDTAYALLSARCQERIAADEFSSAVTMAGAQYGDPLAFDTYSEDQQGTMARVTYTYSDAPEINQDSEPWVNEDGWKQDDC